MENEVYIARFWLDAGFGLVDGFMKHLEIPTTTNCNAVTNSRTLLPITVYA
jgi:hypothetical protein